MNKQHLMFLALALGCSLYTAYFAQTGNADLALLQAAQSREVALVKDLATLVDIDSGFKDYKALTVLFNPDEEKSS